MAKEKKELNIQIGSRIKQAREHAGITQERMAELIGVSVQYTSDLERGKVGASVGTIIRISQCLHTSTDFLLLGHQTKELPPTILHQLSQMTDRQIQIAIDVLDSLIRAFHLKEP